MSPNGVLGDPAGASAEQGRALLAAEHERIVRMVREWLPVAIVTGAARGIGAATVAGLAQAGWAVVAVDVCADDPRLPYAMGTRARAGRGGGPAGAQAVVADATDAEVMAAVVADAERDHGGLDVFIAGAGVIAGGVPLWEMPVEQERAVLSVCLDGVLVGARVAIPALLRRPEPRSGRFLAVASAAASRGLPMLAAYCAAKAGVVGAVRALAVELRGTGISANAVCPGSTRTADPRRVRPAVRPADAEAFAHQQPIERLLEPAEVAAMLVWLAGPGSSAMTGAAVARRRRPQPVAAVSGRLDDQRASPPDLSSASVCSSASIRSGAGAGARRPRAP